VPAQDRRADSKKEGGLPVCVKVEDRDYAVTDDVQWLIQRHPDWKSIRSIGIAESTRQIGEKITRERRCFISSLPAEAEAFAIAVRGHWGIENSL
jgi:predicted transposase YbfD/YdcC